MFSAFSPFGLLEFSSAEPLAKRIYNAIWANLNNGGRTQNYAQDRGYTDTKVYCWSMALARFLTTARRLDAQIDPDTVLELLAEREAEYRLVVPANATIAQRRAALRVAMQAVPPEGWTKATMQQTLADLLGDAFVELREHASVDIVNVPANPAPGPGNFVSPDTPRKLFRLRESASVHLGESWNWIYENLDGSDPSDSEALLEDEVLVVEPTSKTRRERVVVEDELVDNEGVRFLALTLTKPHEPGVLISTQPWPFWLSNRLHWFVRLTEAGATDAETRRLVDEQMARMTHATATWSILGNDGPFVLDESLLDITPF